MSGYSEYKAQMNSQKSKKKKEKTLKIKTKGKGKARKVAEKTLKENLRHEYSASLTVNGDVSYCAGAIVELDETFGKFTGRYIIDKVTHNIDSNYSCSLELLRLGAREHAEKKAKEQTKKK